MNKKRVLTGITTTGTPHLGNYVGAIRPAIRASQDSGNEAFYFLANYHALIKSQDPVAVHKSTAEIAATWLALGLDTDNSVFYRQSDIREIPELTWILNCVCAKGLMNRAHAYKAAVDTNLAENEDADKAITMGLFSYPVLMAADILMFNANVVPVGRDQIQHVEMARDIAQRFNHIYCNNKPLLTLPNYQVDDNVAVLQGLDGRKMSKSYDNTIPLFTPREQLRKLIAGIVTDSRAPGEAKDTEGSALFQIYQAFASAQETAALRQAFADGIAWGDAKQTLFERIDREVAPMRARYQELMQDPEKIEAILLAGADKARRLATPFMRELRQAVGLRQLAAATAPATKSKAVKTGLPVFKQYRETDGRFHFKLLDAQGGLLLQSDGFDSPRDAGKAIALLQAEGAAALAALRPKLQPVPGVSDEAITAALQGLADNAS